MAGGWSEDGAVQKQIDATVDDAIARARSNLRHGESAEFCEDCGEPIPEARRRALPGVQYCVNCQEKIDKREASHSGYNRRGSKDSQLR
ncbi:DksA/TraR family C4-type zinc finger protein [Candidatus Pantoea multigeneris]|uniref:DksA/TraR family C4-type zinc finger protein n=1 Tax=Candidatus Pantoea multigeneris TaxID=2608357 RepID=A0ABX0RA99_9GAMM|nr:DksA/TraR family C4-type zinc finger protein [Pantoea multigeneris]NIF22295.1 DksA/TraR family C4-type zinc finger protein [Pantoea multigeneris]